MLSRDQKRNLSSRENAIDATENILTRVIALKELAERKRREKDRAQGQLESNLERLRREYDCDSEKDARKLLAKLEKGRDVLAKELREGLTEFEGKWKDQLQ